LRVEGRVRVGTGADDGAELGGVGWERDGAGDADGGAGRGAGGEDRGSYGDAGVCYYYGDRNAVRWWDETGKRKGSLLVREKTNEQTAWDAG
jgi:hypothetical protein